MRKLLLPLLAAAGMTLLSFGALAADLDATGGAALLASKEKLTVRGCGKDVYSRFMFLQFFEDGTWEAETGDELGFTHTGVWASKGSETLGGSLHKFGMNMDYHPTTAYLMALMAWKARVLCEETTVAVFGENGLLKIRGRVSKEKIKIKLRMDFETGPKKRGKLKAKFKGTFVPFRPTLEEDDDE